MKADPSAFEDIAPPRKVEDIIAEVLETQPMSVKEIHEQTGLPYKTIDKTLRRSSLFISDKVGRANQWALKNKGFSTPTRTPTTNSDNGTPTDIDVVGVDPESIDL
jgi:hypothetical protein